MCDLRAQVLSTPPLTTAGTAFTRHWCSRHWSLWLPSYQVQTWMAAPYAAPATIALLNTNSPLWRWVRSETGFHISGQVLNSLCGRGPWTSLILLPPTKSTGVKVVPFPVQLGQCWETAQSSRKAHPNVLWNDKKLIKMKGNQDTARLYLNGKAWFFEEGCHQSLCILGY